MQFYQSDQCVPCGDATASYSEFTWQQLLLELKKPGFLPGFLLARQVALGEVPPSWLPRAVESTEALSHLLDETWYFFFIKEWRDANHSCDPLAILQPVVSVNWNGARTVGVLARPQPTDTNPFVYKRLTIRHSTDIKLISPTLRPEMALRDLHAADKFKKCRVSENLALGGDL